MKQALTILLLCLFTHVVMANPMVHQQGTNIVDGSGTPIKLRGFLLEGWLMWNGSLWGAGLTSETAITKKLEAVVGKRETEKFRQKIYDNYITEADIRMIAQFGFNTVRVPFNHRLLEDDDKPFVYKASGWKRLDRLLDWCRKHKVYVVLDLHSAPGGQSGVFVNDPDGSKFYESEHHIKRTVAIWKAIAARYKNRRIIAGYDLLNEPQIPLFTPPQRLLDIYSRIIAAIRQVDRNHMIILSGAGFTSDDLNLFKKPLDANMALAFHTYNFLGTDIREAHHKQYTRVSNKLKVPIWNGEIGAHTAEWVKNVITMLEDPAFNVSGWIFWPWKSLSENSDRFRNLADIKQTPKWDAVRKWIADPTGLFGKKPSRADALQGMQEFLEAMQVRNLVIDKEMKKILTAYN